MALPRGTKDDELPEASAHEGPHGFSWLERKSGQVEVRHHGRLAATLQGAAAQAFLAKVQAGNESAQQHLMARLTGNYKRGNERAAAQHRRNSA
jgi:hypothetical protein